VEGSCSACASAPPVRAGPRDSGGILRVR